MSVINKMLRDLEQRRSIEHGNMDIIRQQHQPVWLTALLCLTLLLALFAIYAVLNRQPAVAKVSEVLPTPSELLSERAPELATVETKTTAKVVEPVLALQPIPERDIVENGSSAAVPIPAAPSNMPTAVQHDSAATASQVSTQRTDTPLPASPLDTPEPQAFTANIAAPQPVTQLSITPSAPSNEQRAATLRQQALAATQAGQWLQAVSYWQQLQHVLPQQAQPYLAQAHVWLQLGDKQQAEQVLQQAAAQGVLNADIQLLLAQAAASRQQWQQVDALLPGQFALAQYPQYYGLKATALQQMAQHQQALLWFDRLTQLQPQQAKWWLGAAISLDALARQAEAKSYYHNALQWGDSLSQQSTDYIHQRLAATE